MTRCKAFYRKMKQIREDKDLMVAFCGKDERTVRGIFAHIDFMDKQFPEWLDADKNGTIVPLSEGATRRLRSLKSKPEALKEALETICELEAPSIEDVRKAIRKAKYDGTEDYLRAYDGWLESLQKCLVRLGEMKEVLLEYTGALSTRYFSDWRWASTAFKYLEIGRLGNIYCDFLQLVDLHTAADASIEAQNLLSWLRARTPEGIAKAHAIALENEASKNSRAIRHLMMSWLCVKRGSDYVRLDESAKSFLEKDYTLEEMEKITENLRQASLDTYEDLLIDRELIHEDIEKQEAAGSET